LSCPENNYSNLLLLFIEYKKSTLRNHYISKLTLIKRVNAELRKFILKIATCIEGGFNISKADEIYKYVKTCTVTKTHAVTKKITSGCLPFRNEQGFGFKTKALFIS
jgi:hypothetical protein